MSEDQPEDALSARLRAADPAVDLPPADPDRVARLLEYATSDTTAPVHTRRPVAWLAAAAVVLVLGGVGLAATLGGGDDPATPPTAGETTEPTEGDGPTVTTLSLGGASPGRCMVPSPDVLGGAAYAVDAEVVAVEGGRATLQPTRWYSGEPTDEVEVAAGSEDLAALIGAPQFETGDRYLVAGTVDGDVMVCGFSGPWSEDLAQLYAEAFGT